MFVKVVTLKYDEVLDGFPQKLIDNILVAGRLLEVREHFFVHGGIPHLVFIFVMDDTTVNTKQARAKEPDPSSELPERLQPLYTMLRRWRNERAKADGVPSYVLFRNAQLAAICRTLPRSKAALMQIEGIGEATCRKYGEELLALIPEDIGSPCKEEKIS